MKNDFKGNHRLVTILPVLSKLYEKSLFKQISSFFKKKFSQSSAASEKVTTRNNVFWQC